MTDHTCNTKKFNLPDYLHIPFFLYQDDRLEKTSTFIAAFFYSLHTAGKNIKASTDYLCQLTKINKRQYYNIMNQLEEFKYIQRTGFTNRKKINWIYNPKSSITVLELDTSALECTTVQESNTSAIDCTKLVHSIALNYCTPLHTDIKEDIKDITTTTGLTSKPVVVVDNSKTLTDHEKFSLSECYEKNPFQSENIKTLEDFLSAALYSLLNREEKFTRQQRLRGILKFVREKQFDEPKGWIKQQRIIDKPKMRKPDDIEFKRHEKGVPGYEWVSGIIEFQLSLPKPDQEYLQMYHSRATGYSWVGCSAYVQSQELKIKQK
ncbi:hypothetical protein [Pedobacter sp.]|jgi:hypothetical protein|uniref:hypothetical protein n=1 Tax=Pedobacter sp. TaxID=1411316 RepID=UPI002B844B78|nr:hypothetical protein [Pedobacter sp.]HWW39658.1 hypothetical protein [Pedobacter sp.]